MYNGLRTRWTQGAAQVAQINPITVSAVSAASFLQKSEVSEVQGPDFQDLRCGMRTAYPWVNKHSYGKWPIEIMDFPIQNGDFL